MPNRNKIPPGLPNRLREWRQIHKLTLEQAAKRIGTTVATLARHETENNKMTLAQLLQYAHVYRVPASDLLPEREPMDPAMIVLLQIGTALTPEELETLIRMAKALPRAKPQKR